eukprot:GFUD01019470.1.p1 GENE.GFUD01019470.1~~GFUD01019470.1.p1  ORF type:complete len:274 (+),score=73.50 GFUD01019470.1:61-882(+)
MNDMEFPEDWQGNILNCVQDKKMSPNKCQLLCLPIELFGQICSFLPAASLCQLEETSRAVQESLEEARAWRGKAMQSNYNFVRAMLEHVRVNGFNDASVFKVIVGTKMIIKELASLVQQDFSHWNFSSEKSLKRNGLFYKICQVMFENFEDYAEKMKIYQKLRLAQVEAWSVESWKKKLDHELLMMWVFQGGLVDVNMAVTILRDEAKARLFTSDSPVGMGAYIGLFLKDNDCLKFSNMPWVGEDNDEEEIFNHGDSDSDHTDIDTDDDFFDF